MSESKREGGVPVAHGSCHCGAVRFAVELPDGLVDPRHCNCSMCRRRGAIVATASPDTLRVVQGEEHLRCYQFNTKTAKHYFCDKCGIYTHHQRRSNPNQYSFNVGCLEDREPFDVEVITVYDGVTHPRDSPDGGKPLGRYVMSRSRPARA